MPLLLVAALCALAPSVTVKVRAQPLARLLPVLSEKVGRRLAVQPALAREQLVIDAENVDPDALLLRIAEVTHAQWVEEAGEYRLRRTAEVERALEREERAFHAENLRREWTEAIRKPYDVRKVAQAHAAALRNRDVEPSEGTGRSPDSLPVMPAERYLPELLLGLPIDALTRLEDRRGIVFSNRPLGSQRPLPAALNPVVARLFRDQEIFSSMGASDTRNGPGGIPPVRIVVSVLAFRRSPGSLWLYAQAILRDERNQVVETAQISTLSPSEDLPAPNAEPPAVLGALAKELEIYRTMNLEEMFMGPTASRVSPALREALLQPEWDGRLTQTWSDVLFDVAKRESKPLVANLLDVHESAETPKNFERASPETFLRSLDGMETKREGGWITLRPRHPGPAGRFRADRTAAREVVRAAVEGRTFSLEEAASINARLGRATSVTHNRTLLLVPPGSSTTDALLSDDFGLEILNALSPEARRALYGARTLSFNVLPPAAQALLRSYYLNSASFSFLIRPDRPEIQDQDDDEPLDATDLIGPGQIPGLVLSAQVENGFAFVAQAAKRPEIRQRMDAETLIRYIDADLRPVSPPEEDGLTFDRFQVIGFRQITLKIHFPNGYRQEIWMSDYQIDPQAPFLSMEKLPEPIREHLRKLKREAGGTFSSVSGPVSTIGVTTGRYGTSP